MCVDLGICGGGGGASLLPLPLPRAGNGGPFARETLEDTPEEPKKVVSSFDILARCMSKTPGQKAWSLQERPSKNQALRMPLFFSFELLRSC